MLTPKAASIDGGKDRNCFRSTLRLHCKADAREMRLVADSRKCVYAKRETRTAKRYRFETRKRRRKNINKGGNLPVRIWCRTPPIPAKSGYTGSETGLFRVQIPWNPIAVRARFYLTPPLQKRGRDMVPWREGRASGP